MLVEFLAHLVALDLPWIANLILANLHWLFAFVAAVYIFYDGKRVVAPFILTVGLTWTITDFSTMSGWVWAVPTFLAFYYISRIALIIYCSEINKLKNILPVVFVVHFLAIYIIFNLFIN